MMTRLLALAIAATGLSVGGFQLGTRQAQTVPPTEAVPSDLPADHAISVALQEPASKVPALEKARLRSLITDMEKAKKVEETTRVGALNARIADLERQLVLDRKTQRSYDVRIDSKELAKGIVVKGTARKGKGGVMEPYEVRYRAIPNKETLVKLEKAERVRAQQIVEDRFEAIAIDGMPAMVANRVRAEARAIRAEEGERGFALLLALRERTALGLTPKQVTQLQLLQADFLRRFAPMREQTEVDLMFEVVGQPLPDKNLKEVEFKAVKDEPSPHKTGEVRITYGFSSTPAIKVKGEPITEKGDVVYVVEAQPRVKVDNVIRLSGKSVPSKAGQEFRAISVVLAKPNDVEKRIQALKDEIDDKAYEILNDDQGKRLRRMVALSLSPNP